jgi:hypothetical protein
MNIVTDGLYHGGGGQLGRPHVVASGVSHARRGRRPCARAPAALLVLLLLGGAPAQGDAAPMPPLGQDAAPGSAIDAALPGAPLAARQEGLWRYLAVTDLARALGAPVEARDGVLTLRSRAGVLTAFARSPDALWQRAGSPAAEEFSSGSPVLVVDGAWFLPEDMVSVLGVFVDGEEVTLPGGDVRRLVVARPSLSPSVSASEVLELGSGVMALRLYASSPSGPDSVSLLAVDLGLLALAYPEQRVALDAQLRRLHADKVLFLVVTSLGRAVWDPAIYVVQDGVEVLLRAPLAVQVLSGDPDALTPASPVAAVAFLPSTFDLRRPLQIRWAGATGSVTLRR